jgi:hypothetical protein
MVQWYSSNGLGMALNSAMRVCARVQIPVCPEPPLVFSHELLGRLRTEFLVVSPLRIACVFLHVERGRCSKRVWRSHRHYKPSRVEPDTPARPYHPPATLAGEYAAVRLKGRDQPLGMVNDSNTTLIQFDEGSIASAGVRCPRECPIGLVHEFDFRPESTPFKATGTLPTFITS